MLIKDYIVSEVTRQKSDKFYEMAGARKFAAEMLYVEGPIQFGQFVQSIAAMVEPDVNRLRFNGETYTNLRVSEVGFANGGRATKAAEVQHQFHRLMNQFDIIVSMSGDVEIEDQDIDLWIKTLLEIHPFQDGNGRTASILRNWLRGTLDNPDPLPYYFPE